MSGLVASTEHTEARVMLMVSGSDVSYEDNPNEYHLQSCSHLIFKQKMDWKVQNPTKT